MWWCQITSRAIQLQGPGALLQGRLSFQSRRFSDPTYHTRSHRAAWVARLTYAGLQHKNPISALCGFLMKTKLLALRLSCWKVLTLLTPKVPLKESDNLPQVGRSQTSAAAKLILNSPLTLASFKIYLARLSFETFPFLVELQPSFVFVIWRVLFLSIRVAGVVNQ